MENTRFPGFSEKQVQWLEDKTAHLEGFAKTQAQQELYRKLLPQVQGKQFQEQRQELKNQAYYKAQQSQIPAFVKKTEVDLRKEDLADFAKQKHGLNQQLNTTKVFEGILKEAQARNINMQSLNNYLNNGDETFLYEMGFKQAPIRQGGIKRIASSIAGDWGWGEWVNPIGKITETIDDLVQKIPTLSEEEWDQFAKEKLGGFGEGMGMLPAIITNSIPSLLKTATGTVRGLTNPFDTAYGLGTLVGTKEGRGILKNRYWDDLKNTATEDPVGLASDFLTLVAGGAGAVSKVSNISSKAAKLGKLSNTASKLSSVATKAGDFAKIAGGAADLGLDVLHNGMLGKLAEAISKKSGLAKGGLKYLQYTQKPLQSLSDLKDGVIKSLDKHLIDERTKKALENNPYIVKWWQKTKNYIDGNGLSPESKKEINASHIQELGSEILDLIEKRKESLSESGKGYEEIRNQNQIFDNSITKPKLDYFLEEKGIKVKDGVLDFEDSTVVKDADMKAIQRAYEWIIRPEYDAKSGLAQRRKLDQLAYPDGKPSEGTKIIKGMRKVFDTTMKESISGLKEVDDNFSQQIQALNKIQEGLVYKDGARKGEIRDNFNQIINTLDGPNRAVMAERLNQLRPGLLEEIQAVHHMKKLTDAYYRTPVMWKSMLAKGGGMILGGVGGAGHGPLGVAAGALAGFFAEKGLSKYSQSRVQKMIDGLGKEAKMKLEKIGGKLEADKELTEKEDRLMQEIAEKLQDQKNLPQEEGLGKLREGAETTFQKIEGNEKYGIADATEKTLSAQQAKQIKNIRNGRSVEEIANDYGIAIEVADKITTPEGIRAYGKYGDGVITLAEKIKEGTAPHELFHATFDMVDHARKESILRQIEKSKGLDSLNAEEYLADSFSEYFRTGKFDTKSFGKGLVEKIKQYFYQVKQFITGANKNKAQVKKLFDEILDGEIDREMLGEVLGNKKGTDTHRHQQSGPRLVSVPVKSSIPITPENASIFTSKLNNLSKVVKSGNFDAVDFLDGLKNNLNIDKKSGYLISQKGGLTATLRISDHYANARNNKIRGYVENNTSIVIKLGNGKFKAKNGVDLIEFVYDPKNLTPEKMQGIIKGIQDWIDTGNYTDKGYDHTHKSIRATLEGGEVKYQLVYHGSPYEFEKFDSSHMGKGEGAQAHGWGHYVAVDKETAEKYANITKMTYKGKEIPHFTTQTDATQRAVYAMLHYIDGLGTFEEKKSYVINKLKKEKTYTQETIQRFGPTEELSATSQERLQELKNIVKELEEEIEIIGGMQEGDFGQYNKNFYEVDIPDLVKANTPTGSNYFEEQGKIKSKAVDTIVKQLKKGLSEEKVVELDELVDSWESGYDHSIEGGRMYHIIKTMLGSDKKASKFLETLGYDGIHYHGKIDGEAYVIFDDAKLEIKNHSKL